MTVRKIKTQYTFFSFLQALYFSVFLSQSVILSLLQPLFNLIYSPDEKRKNCLKLRHRHIMCSSSSVIVNPVCVALFVIFSPIELRSEIVITVRSSMAYNPTFTFLFLCHLYSNQLKFYNRINRITFYLNDSIFGAAMFHCHIDKLFVCDVWISLPLSLSLLLPDVSLQLLWLTANSFITGHKRQVPHLKGRRHPLSSNTSEKSTCRNSIQGTLFHYHEMQAESGEQGLTVGGKTQRHKRCSF